MGEIHGISKGWKTKELQTVVSQGTEEMSYKLLLQHFHVVKYVNPGTIIDVKTESDEDGLSHSNYPKE